MVLYIGCASRDNNTSLNRIHLLFLSLFIGWSVSLDFRLVSKLITKSIQYNDISYDLIPWQNSWVPSVVGTISGWFHVSGSQLSCPDNIVPTSDPVTGFESTGS